MYSGQGNITADDIDANIDTVIVAVRQLDQSSSRTTPAINVSDWHECCRSPRSKVGNHRSCIAHVHATWPVPVHVAPRGNRRSDCRSNIIYSNFHMSMSSECNAGGSIESATPETTTDIDAAAPHLPIALRRIAGTVHAKAGSVLFDQCRQPDTIYHVLSGIVSVRRRSYGAPLTMQTAVSGDWLLGAQEASSSAPVSAVCEKRTMLLALPAHAFFHSLEQNPCVARLWWREMSRQMSRLQKQTERLRLPLTAHRIEHYLITESPNGCGELTLPYPKRIWAEHLAVTPPTLSRVLGAMEADGRVAYRGRCFRLLKRLDATVS